MKSQILRMKPYYTLSETYSCVQKNRESLVSLESCRGQWYHGASNILEKVSAIAKQILEIQPKAFLPYCHFLSLSLSVKEMAKESKSLSNTMDTSAEITILIKYSPKTEQILEQIKRLSLSIEDESEKNQTIQFSKLSTGWTVCSKWFRRILENYSYFYELWSKCLEKLNLIRCVIDCKAQLEDFKLFLG